jgi:hypothetical protein
MPSTSLRQLERIAAALETIAAASEPASRAEVKAAFHALAEAKGLEYCTALLRLWRVERYVEVEETGLFVAALNAARREGGSLPQARPEAPWTDAND